VLEYFLHHSVYVVKIIDLEKRMGSLKKVKWFCLVLLALICVYPATSADIPDDNPHFISWEKSLSGCQIPVGICLFPSPNGRVH